MNPKEKAKQLIDKFWYVEPIESCDGMEYHMAQQCALIAVDEIINTIEQIFETFEERKYWNEVKQEINNL